MDTADELSMMDLINTPTFWLVGLLVGTVSMIFVRLFTNAYPGKAPPVWEGVPFIGGFLKFIRGPYALLDEGYKKMGEVFTVPVAHKSCTFLLGPHVTPHFFKASDDHLSQKEVYEFNVPIFGPGVVYDVESKVRNEQFKFFADALKTQKLKEYIPLFELEAISYFSKYAEQGTVDFAEEFSKLITMTASRTLLGREIRENLFEEVSDLLHDLDAGMLPISVFFPYLPIPAHIKRDKSRKKLASIFNKVLQERRASGAKEVDMLQHYMECKYQHNYGGRYLNDEEIGGMLIAALFAGQHTSSITSSWTGYQLCKNREWWNKVVEEQKRVLKEYGERLDYEVLNDMPVLHNCILEALRMNPPLILLLRYARQSFSVTTREGKQYTIPQGHIVMTSPTYTHRLTHLFDNPVNFEPDRFEPPREEDKKMPFTNISFGGGRHGCMGHNFAMLQIKVIWSTILRNFDMEVVGEIPEPDYEAMVIGPKAGKVKFTRRTLSV